MKKWFLFLATIVNILVINAQQSDFIFVEEAVGENFVQSSPDYNGESFAKKSVTKKAQQDIDKQISVIVSPNPADQSAVCRYTVPNKYNRVDFILRNSLGTVVQKYELKVSANSKLVLNTANLSAGVYFYSVVADGQSLMTRKLIIKH